MWRILETEPQSAEHNMSLESSLLEQLQPHSKPLLHLYEWKRPSITYGYFLKKEDFFHLDAINRYGIDLARRPTGGGILFHMWDLTFSFLIPSNCPYHSQDSLDNYRTLNGLVKRAIEHYLLKQPLASQKRCLFHLPDTAMTASQGDSTRHFCMAKPTQFDLILQGRKVAGAALRRKRQGALYQGAIFLTLPDPQLLEQTLLPHLDLYDPMCQQSTPLLGTQQEVKDSADLETARADLRSALKQVLAEEDSDYA